MIDNLYNEIGTLNKQLSNLKNDNYCDYYEVQSFDVTVTTYNPTRQQCDDTPDITADGTKIKPWKATEELLKKAESKTVKTEKLKEKQKERIKKIKSTIKNRKAKHTERIEKLELQVSLSEKTRDYNLGTSLRNYIDPRIFKTWTDEVGAEWEKLYTSALQKKFLWVKDINSKLNEISKEY